MADEYVADGTPASVSLLIAEGMKMADEDPSLCVRMAQLFVKFLVTIGEIDADQS